MTPEEIAAKTCQSVFSGHHPSNCLVCGAIADALRAYGDARAAEERAACATLVEGMLAGSSVEKWIGEWLATLIRARSCPQPGG